jgi:HSP20 family molecular chaperone IbpA
VKNARGYMDLGTILDEIFEAAAQNFSDFQRHFDPFDPRCRDGMRGGVFDETTDYYPNYSYPPMNVYLTGDRSMVFEFALAGFDEKDISLSFQGDYMVFSARIGDEYAALAQQDPQSEENVRYFKRRLKLKDIEKQKYYVPLDKYAQEKVKAGYKNGILKVRVPPKDEPEQSEGIKIEIVKEED